jgi:YggT family protein
MQAMLFLIETFFQLLALVFILRLILYAVRADFYNPLSQFVYRVTNPVIAPLRKVIPNVGKVELATTLMIIVVEALGLTLRALLSGFTPAPGPVLITAVLEALRSGFSFLMFALIVNVILSWVPNMSVHPLARLLSQICDPILRPIRSILPVIAGLDLSPLIAIILLQAILIQLRAFG